MSSKDMPLATRQGASHPAPVASAAPSTPTPTPTPWVLGKHNSILGGARYEFTNGWAQRQIASVMVMDEGNGDQAANAAFIVQACNSHAALVKALEAQEAADKADADAVDLVERATGEGWLYEPTGGSHINDAYATAARLRREARDLARAALALATKET